MDEYIEREAALKAIRKAFVWAKRQDDQYDESVRQIERIPAADVVPVVRCGECRYAYDSVGGWCCSHGVCVDCIVREDFFCADGERKDGDGDG